MSALSTNYGAPAQLRTPSNTKRSDNSYALSSFSRNRLEKVKTLKAGRGSGREEMHVPETRWDGVDHHASVIVGDGIDFGSRESIQMIIQKNTEWDVAFEGRGRGLSQGSDFTSEHVRAVHAQ